jgi:putative Mn2+ efflux pump MntP
MPLYEIILLALSLAADAFAVSIAVGSTGMSYGPRSMVRLSFHFGLFQFLMPILGWLAGLTIARYVESIDHWIVFGLLLWTAIHMIRSTLTEEEQAFQRDPTRGMIMVILSVATSLDALAIGLSLAFLRVSIWYPSAVIGLVTGIISLSGILLGRKFSRKFGKRAAQGGAILLILIGIRILVSHIFSL